MSFNLDSATILYQLYDFGYGLGTMIVLLVVCLLELHLDAFERHIDGLAHVFFIGGSNHLRTGNIHSNFTMALMFNFVVKKWSRITEALVIFG